MLTLFQFFNQRRQVLTKCIFGGEEEEICGTTTSGFYQKLFYGMAGKGDGLAQVLEKVWRPVLTTIVMIFMIIIMSIKSFIYHFRLTLEYIMLV